MTPVLQKLKEREVPFEVIDHPRAYTGIDEAKAMGIHADEVLKTVVVDAVDGLKLLVIPASRRLDMHLVRAAVDDSKADLAPEDEIEWRWPKFELGALPPLGSILEIPMYADPEIFVHDTVVFAAGEQTRSIKMRTSDLFLHETFTVTPLTVSTEEITEDWGNWELIGSSP